MSDTRAMVAVTCVMLGLVTTAKADVAKGQGEIGFDFGVTSFDSSVSDETGGRLAFRGGHHFTDVFQFDAQLGSSKASSHGVEAKLDTVFANCVFNFHPSPHVVPYVLVGVGMAEVAGETDDFTADDRSLATQVGVGSRFYFGKTRRSAVRIELCAIRETTFDDPAIHPSLVTGFTWVLGGS